MPRPFSLRRFRERRQRLRDQLRAREPRRGLLIAFEGPDGSGKTTQRKLFKNWLQGEGYRVVTTKWNSSPLIKPLIKTRKAAHALSPEEFCLLHAADFRHRLETVILPALWEGKTVVADRFLFTALARDAARGLDWYWVLQAYRPLFWPDMVFYFSVSPETSGKRISAVRTPKYYEAGQDVTGLDDPMESYHQFISRVIQEYEALAQVFRFVRVDAEQSIYDQHRLIRELFLQGVMPQSPGARGGISFSLSRAEVENGPDKLKLVPQGTQHPPETEALLKGSRRPWAEWNEEAISDWLAQQPPTSEVRLAN